MTTIRSLAALAGAACLVLGTLPAAAAIHLQLGDVGVVEGASVALPFTLTLDEDLVVYAIDATLDFDTTRLAIDTAAPMLGGMSLDELDAMPGWIVASDEQGVVISGAPPNPFLHPFQMSAGAPYAGTLTFTGLAAGVDPVPVVATLSICDRDGCFFADPIEPQVVQATGHVTVSAIPEPPRWALAGAGLLAMGLWARRRRAD